MIGTGDYVLADGTQVTNFLANGSVQIGRALYLSAIGAPEDLVISASQSDIDASENVEGIIVLSGEDALVGMEFIRMLKKSLIIYSTIVGLVDEIDPPQPLRF